MKKRMIGILLTLCMVFSLLPAAAGAANVLCSGTCGENAVFVFTDDGVMTISGTGAVTAPQTAEGAFRQYRDVNTIVIEEGITAIGDNAFWHLYNEQLLVLPNSLQTIGDNSFHSHLNLNEIRFGTGLKSIGNGAFDSCTFLSELNLPKGLESIGSSAFSGCSRLKSVTIPGSVKTVGDYAFNACTWLEDVDFREGVETLGTNLFWFCRHLKSVYLPDTIRSIGSSMFSVCPALQSVRLPANITSIPEYTFADCTNLKYVVIPGAVKQIEQSAFANCSSLEALYYVGTEDMLNAIWVEAKGNSVLENVLIYLLPAMPDPIFGMYDLPKRTNWAYPGIAFCLSTGLMNGTGNRYFEPNATTTRGQLVTILWRMLDEPAPTQAAPFTDLKQKYYRNAIAWAAENNIVKGVSDTRFDPDAPITREELVTIFYRLCKDYLGYDMSPAVALDSFPDGASVSPFARNAMQWAVAVKLIKGSTEYGVTYLKPKDTATRAQIATVMLNFCNTFAEDAE